MAGVDAGHPGVLREAALRGRRRGRRHRRARATTAGCRCRSATPAGSTRLTLAARAAVVDGELGWVHTVRSTTLDPAPPPAAYVAVSGGIFRDCTVARLRHRPLGRPGARSSRSTRPASRRGDDFFAELGDVATAQTAAHLRRRRHRGRVQHPLQPARATTSGSSCTAPPTASPPAGATARRCATSSRARAGRPARRATFFMDRLAAAFRAELTAFTEVVAGRDRVALHRRRRAGRGLDRRGSHPFPATAPPGADRRGPAMTTTPTTTATAPVTPNRAADRRRTDLLGCLRGARLGLPAHPEPGARRDARRRPCRHRVRPGRASCRPTPSRWPGCSQPTS